MLGKTYVIATTDNTVKVSTQRDKGGCAAARIMLPAPNEITDLIDIGTVYYVCVHRCGESATRLTGPLCPHRAAIGRLDLVPHGHLYLVGK